MKKLKVGIVGATGYTGEELVRLLARHSEVEVTYASGKADRAMTIQEVFPHLSGVLDIPCSAYSADEAALKADILFLSLPHTVSMREAPAFLAAGKKVIDMSADYRLSDTATYEKFYKVPHSDAANLAKAVYGIPELNREKIRSAALVANPGCYPTGAILGIAPGLAQKAFDADSIRIDAKSGVTGAGRKADASLNFAEVNENLKAYKPFEHQHVPEIEQELTKVAGSETRVVFVPHLIPMNRGILTTIYVDLAKKLNTEALVALYRDFYKDEPFVNVYPAGRLPEVKHVARTNLCAIGLKVDEERGVAVVVTAIDNLGKGAAGQAVQNMNIMYGFPENSGL